MKSTSGKSDQLNEVFYRMMVDYYEGLAKAEHELTMKEIMMTPNSMTTKMKEA